MRLWAPVNGATDAADRMTILTLTFNVGAAPLLDIARAALAGYWGLRLAAAPAAGGLGLGALPRGPIGTSWGLRLAAAPAAGSLGTEFAGAPAGGLAGRE